MNTILKTAVALSLMLVLLSHADANSKEAAESTPTTASGVVGKVEKAVVRGAQSAADGIEHGMKAVASGVERGATAATSGIKRGARATTRGVEHGAKATASATRRAANKVGTSFAPSSSPGN